MNKRKEKKEKKIGRSNKKNEAGGGGERLKGERRKRGHAWIKEKRGRGGCVGVSADVTCY